MQVGSKRQLQNKQSDKQLLIEKFIKPEFIPTDKNDPNTKKFWAAQMRLASLLIKLYGVDFLLWVTPPVRYNSLVSYSGKWGKKFFSEQLYEFKKNMKPPETALVRTDEPEGEKIGEDVVVNNKPKTLQDFLKLYK